VKILLQIVLASMLVSLVSFIGIIFFSLGMNIRRITFYLISLASGTLLGGAVLHLIPEALETSGPKIFESVAMGIFIFFILEKFLIWRHCHIHQRPHDHTKPVAAKMVLIGDAIHNAIDGAIIASAFMTSTDLGISITIAIILHEIPQELGDFGILIHGGYTMQQALWLNALTATSSLVGAVIAFFFIGASTMVATHILPVAAGGLLYIALADLIPQLHDQIAPGETVLQILLLAAGFGAMILLKHAH
jgi:zinc and cadmium transporter